MLRELFELREMRELFEYKKWLYLPHKNDYFFSKMAMGGGKLS